MIISEKKLNAVGAIVRVKVPGDCELSREKLQERLRYEAMCKYMPSKRAYSDALRCALTATMAKSVRQNSDGSVTSLLVEQIPKKKGETFQKWGVLRLTKDREDQVLNHEDVGYVTLFDNGSLSVPPALSDVDDVFATVQHYIDYANNTKLRETINAILVGEVKPLPLDGLVFVPHNKMEFLKEVIRPIFSNLDAGEIRVSVYPISADPEFDDIKADVKDSMADAINGIKAGIIEAKNKNSAIQKSVILEWIKTIDTLRANMDAVGVLGIPMPDGIDDLELQVAALRAEVDKPGNKRKIHVVD